MKISMIRKRIGNDIHVRWEILLKSTRELLSLSGKKVSLYLKHCYENRTIDDFTIVDNVVNWVFRGATQKHTGVYSLVLVVNEGTEGMITVDVCKFVEIVSSSCQEGGVDTGNIHTESIDLISTIDYVSVVGGSSVTVDTELSETSENPIANKTVAFELKKKADASKLTELSLQVGRVSEAVKVKVDATYVDNAINAAIGNVINGEY